MEIEVQGQVDRIVYCNEENFYTVAKLNIKGQRELITITGNLFSINPGEVLALKGLWYSHPKYGRQFQVSSYKSLVPSTVKGIERYLGSGLIKGIGPVMANRIVAKFGVKTLDIIEKSIDRLKEVEGFGEKRIEMIKNAWEEHKEIKEVMLFLQSHEVSSAYAIKIFKQYGQKSIDVVKENPYRMATDIFGVGFITADKIAEKLGFSTESEVRIEAGILYVLQQLSEDGHVYYPYDLLLEECMKILNVEKENVIRAIDKITLENKIVMENIDGEEFGKAVYLKTFYVSETGISKNLKKLLNADKKLGGFDEKKALDWVQKQLGITLVDNQKRAIKESYRNKVMIITGGPGTGKTTIINSIIRIYSQLKQRILLAAPTGRASKRMTEVTGYKAKTIHRLLEFSPREGKFKRNEYTPLDTNLIVIDEASMMDTVLMHHFLKAVPVNATLILVGDVDQLPSVGAGSVLKDLIDSGAIPTVRLNEIFRQSRESHIIVNAHKINNGDMPLLSYSKDRKQDFYFFKIEDPEEILKKILELCIDRIPGRFGFDSVNDIQVITPMHKGILGAINLNMELQNALNRSTIELTRGGKVFRKGDKVMQIVNNYEKDVFNGDIGIITRINSEDNEITVNFYDRYVNYDFKDMDEIVLAYAVSVHKSQGSEYPVVIMPVHTQHYILLQRNLLYTGITRGKKLVILLGTKKALAIAIKNDKPRKRYTHLKYRLQQNV